MATRFYLSSSSSAPMLPADVYINVAPTSSWQETAALVHRRCSEGWKRSTAMTSIASTSSATSPETHATARFFSDPLEAQTISGTVSGQIRCLESASAGTGTVAIGIRVITPAGTVRGTLLNVTGAALDYATSLTNRSIAGPSSSTAVALTSTAVTAGDVIEIVLGTRDVDTNASRSYTINIGDNAGSDLAVDQSTTTANNPWVEFSQDLIFMDVRRPEFIDGPELQDGGHAVPSGMTVKGTV